MNIATIDAASHGDYRPVVYLDEKELPSPVLERALAVIAERGAAGANRYVIHVHSDELLARVHSLWGAGQLVQIFVDDQVEAELPGIIRFPPGSNRLDIQNFGLAMSDAVLAEESLAETMLADRARRIGKPIVDAEAVSSPIGALLDSGRREGVLKVERHLRDLDPDQVGGWRRFVLRQCGRIDATTMHLMGLFDCLPQLAQGRRGREAVGRQCGRLRDTFTHWRVMADFAPRGWETICPSDPVRADGALIQQFETFDRAALAGARLYRDTIWALHAFAFLAVLIAVAGRALAESVDNLERITPWLEITSLTLVVFLVRLANRLHHRWTACRVGAEQLRVAGMALPLLIVPPMLLSADSDPDTPDHARPAKVNEAAVALALAKRAVRRQGPSAIRQPPSITSAVAWLELVVKYQYDYHFGNHQKLQAMEKIASLINYGLFMVIVIAVFVEIHEAWSGEHPADPAVSGWLLILTAAGPALVAALHGALGKLEVLRRSELR